jgi:hypothetical protein
MGGRVGASAGRRRRRRKRRRRSIAKINEAKLHKFGADDRNASTLMQAKPEPESTALLQGLELRSTQSG